MLDRLNGGFELGAAGHEHHRYIQIPAANRTQQTQPVHAGHTDIADNHIEAGRFNQLERFGPIAGRGHLVTRVRE